MSRSSQRTHRSAEGNANDTKDLVKDILKEMVGNADFHKLLSDCIEKVLEKKFAKIRDEQEKQETRIFDLEKALEKKEKAYDNMKTTMDELNSTTNKLKEHCNTMEQYSRRNCLRIFGVPENTNEDTTQLILEIAKKKLNITTEESYIDRTHRIGPRSDGKRPRAIIAKFTSYRARHLSSTIAGG